jgi:hypothetical protein
LIGKNERVTHAIAHIQGLLKYQDERFAAYRVVISGSHLCHWDTGYWLVMVCVRVNFAGLISQFDDFT